MLEIGKIYYLELNDDLGSRIYHIQKKNESCIVYDVYYVKSSHLDRMHCIADLEDFGILDMYKQITESDLAKYLLGRK